MSQSRKETYLIDGQTDTQKNSDMKRELNSKDPSVEPGVIF